MLVLLCDISQGVCQCEHVSLCHCDYVCECACVCQPEWAYQCVSV